MIIVFGSINMDFSIVLDQLPGPGETVLSQDYTLTPGGKGGNQALAAARPAMVANLDKLRPIAARHKRSHWARSCASSKSGTPSWNASRKCRACAHSTGNAG